MVFDNMTEEQIKNLTPEEYADIIMKDITYDESLGLIRDALEEQKRTSNKQYFYVASFNIYNGETLHKIIVKTEAHDADEAREKFLAYEKGNVTDKWRLMEFEKVSSLQRLLEFI